MDKTYVLDWCGNFLTQRREGAKGGTIIGQLFLNSWSFTAISLASLRLCALAPLREYLIGLDHASGKSGRETAPLPLLCPLRLSVFA
jgi:hypothetical protein